MHHGCGRPRDGPFLEWEFVPRPVRESGRFLPNPEAGTQRALSAAAGLGLNLELVWATGSPPQIRLRGIGQQVGAWVDRVLAGSYDLGQWRQCEVVGVPTWGEDRFGFISDADVPPDPERTERWATPTVLGLAAFPRGLEACWNLIPTREVRRDVLSSLLDGWLLGMGSQRSETRHNFGFRDRPQPSPAVPPRWRWAATVRVRACTPRTVEWLPQFERSVSDASTVVGKSIRFGRWRRKATPWLMTEEVATGLWPSRSWVQWDRKDHAGRGALQWPIGRTLAGRPVHMSYSLAEGRHLAVLGETGMGKSSFLIDLAVRAARTANIVLVDPIGDTARRFVNALAPERHRDLAFLSPSDAGPTLNAVRPTKLAGPPAHATTPNVAELVTALRRVRHQRYGDTPFWGPRIEDALYRVISIVAAQPRGTLTDAWNLLEGESPECEGFDPQVASEVRRLSRWVLQRPEEVDGARRLLAEVARPEALRRLLCDPDPSWSLDDVETEGRITVVSGEAGSVGESAARSLTTILVALLWGHLLGRSPRRKLCLVLDEAQWYAHEAVAEAFRVARRLNVHVWLATQSLDSLASTTREAAETNVSDWVLFRGASLGLRSFHRESPWVSAAGSVVLEKGEALWVEGKGVRCEVVDLRRVPTPQFRGQGARGDRAHRDVYGLDQSDPASSPSSYGPDALPRSAVGSGAPPRFRVYWADHGVIPSSFAPIRILGGELGRRQWILGSGSDARGRYWVVPPEAKAAVERSGFTLETDPASESPAVGTGPAPTPPGA